MILVAVDLDGTVWSHPDISVLKKPFKKLGQDTLVDAEGTVIRLRPRIREFLEELRKIPGVLVTTLSWNRPDNALEALSLLGLKDLFDYIVIEDHPHKDRMLEKLFQQISRPPKQGCLVYLDDRTIHVEDIRRNIDPQVLFIQAPARDEEMPRTLSTVLEEIRKRIDVCGKTSVSWNA